MIKNISMYILDLVYASIRAEASLIIIDIEADTAINELSIRITDDGKGFDNKQLLDYSENLGAGILRLKQVAEKTGGRIEVSSKEGMGTVVSAFFKMPTNDSTRLGDIEEIIGILLSSSPDRDFILNYQTYNGECRREFNFDTREIKEELEEIDIDEYEIIDTIKNYIKENIKATNGGLVL